MTGVFLTFLPSLGPTTRPVQWQIMDIFRNAVPFNCYKTTSTNDKIENDNVIVYPNPFTNKINLLNTKGDKNFILTNALGQTVYSGKNIAERDFSPLNNGIYFLTITDLGKKETPQYFKLLKR